MSGYTPIFSTVFDGSLYGKWPDSAVWLTMLALADSRGNVDMSYEAISGRTGWPMDLLRQAITALMQPDPNSRTPTLDGRRLVPLDPTRTWGWHVVNHAAYREKARLMAKREREVETGANAARMRDRRGPPETAGDRRRPPETAGDRRGPPETAGDPLSYSDTSSEAKASGAKRRKVASQPAESKPTDGTDADPIWSLGVQILGESSRTLLGRLVRDHGREPVAAKIGALAAMSPRPVDPKSWLIGALKPRERKVVV